MLQNVLLWNMFVSLWKIKFTHEHKLKLIFYNIKLTDALRYEVFVYILQGIV